MERKKLKIGICGGTFDPIHMGHLIIAEMARCQYGLDKVLFIPSGKPPHKDLQVVTEPIHRLNMVECATQNNPYFEALDIEIMREGYTYTVDTLKDLHKLFPRETDFYYIIGADVVRDLPTWKSIGEVSKQTKFIAFMRPEFINEEFSSQIQLLRDKFHIVVDTFEAPLIEISSTYIRDSIRKGQTIKYIVPECVEKYIRDNDLYLTSQSSR